VTYHGEIREDAKPGDEVEMDLQIMARDRTKLQGDEVCGYTLYKSHSELPFKLVIKNHVTGKAVIVLADGYKLNYERRKFYTFEIAPHDCVSGQHADREVVRIEVKDVNEYAPELEQDSYIVEVLEGKIFDEILRLQARDRDSSDAFSKICHYHILTPDVPFRIDSDGVLYNTEPLDYSRKHNFILEVKVEDCGGHNSRSSNKVMVNIKVKEACKPGRNGISDRIEYAPGMKQKLLGEQASLKLCDPACSEAQVSARIVLTTKHIGKGCDRDTYSIQSQRKLCGASSGSIDLLPSPSLSALTKALPTDDGKEADQIFAFDGERNAIEIPSTKLNHTLDSHFTISTWMKHEQDPEDETKNGAKEHILCNTDGEKMSRHHYSLFIHNCRLVFLLRQEPYGNDLNVFKPAEWRWKIPQVCDGQWHHYAISVDFPQVRLYIDGKLFVNGKNNPEIIDDWPLHPSKKIHFTKLVVGACWQERHEASADPSVSGHTGRLDQFFRGYLAGLTILKGKTESDRVIRCLNDCKEKLDFHAMSEMESGMSVAFNSEMTEITINGHNHTEVEKLVRRVGYINSRMFPTPGHRALKIETDTTCSGGQKVQVPDLNAMIVVLQAEKPIITVSGTTNLARNENDFLNGQKIFWDLSIMSRTRKEEEEAVDGDDKEQDTRSKPQQSAATLDWYHLDSCVIRADPPLNLEVEHLKWPENLMAQLGMEATQNEKGLLISGADRVYNYEEVLRQVQYVNRKPDDLNSRSFILTCSELNGRFISNEFHVQVDVIHTVHRAPVQQPQAHIHDSQMKVDPVQKLGEIHLDEEPSAINMVHHNTGTGVTIIIVVCVGFLIFMIVLGVIRIRAAHQRSQVVTVEERPEMEWDNSALTITVNPMDTEGATYGDEHELNALRGEDSDSDDDDGSSFHDEIESSEEESEKVKDRELEWDDSTLTF